MCTCGREKRNTYSSVNMQWHTTTFTRKVAEEDGSNTFPKHIAVTTSSIVLKDTCEKSRALRMGRKVKRENFQLIDGVPS